MIGRNRSCQGCPPQNKNYGSTPCQKITFPILLHLLLFLLIDSAKELDTLSWMKPKIKKQKNRCQFCFQYYLYIALLAQPFERYKFSVLRNPARHITSGLTKSERVKRKHNLKTWVEKRSLKLMMRSHWTSKFPKKISDFCLIAGILIFDVIHLAKHFLLSFCHNRACRKDKKKVDKLQSQIPYHEGRGNKEEVEKIKQQIEDIWERTREAAFAEWAQCNNSFEYGKLMRVGKH